MHNVHILNIKTLDALGRAQRLDQIKKIERETFPKTEAFDFDLECRKANTTLLLASSGPNTIGYVVYQRLRRRALLHKICVSHDCRHAGHGRMLLEAAIHDLERTGCSAIELWVDVNRMAARQLYSAVGFIEVQRLDDYYSPGRDALKMALSLPE